MFGITPFERNELWNPFREFENDFSRASELSATAAPKKEKQQPEVKRIEIK